MNVWTQYYEPREGLNLSYMNHGIEVYSSMDNRAGECSIIHDSRNIQPEVEVRAVLINPKPSEGVIKAVNFLYMRLRVVYSWNTPQCHTQCHAQCHNSYCTIVWGQSWTKCRWYILSYTPVSRCIRGQTSSNFWPQVVYSWNTPQCHTQCHTQCHNSYCT